MAVFPDAQGVDTLCVAVKATFTLGSGPRIAKEQVLPVLADEYHGEPGASSLKYAGEMHLPKPGTDVALVGSAHAPAGRAVAALDVELAVGELRKTVRVFGDREWKGGLLSVSPTSPKPFTEMPLRFERAFGGVHVVDEEKGIVLAEERNPVGVGFAGKRKAKDLVGQPLPNLEDPRQLLQKPGGTADPACFGFVAPSWLPRRSHAGTYDEAWQKKRAPYLPKDFDARFFLSASAGLSFDRYLGGGETVRIVNAGRKGPIQMELPRGRVDVVVRIAGTEHRPPAKLETVLFEPDEDRFTMLWRAVVPCDKKVTRIESVTIAAAGFGGR